MRRRPPPLNSFVPIGRTRSRLLAEQEAKLKEMERKERGD
jgi:hypothetical protein